MGTQLILVADSSRARLFVAEKTNAGLNEIETFSHPEGRLHEQNMSSDLPGRHVGNTGSGSHTYQEETEPKEQEMIDFAKRLTRHLDDLVSKHKVNNLSIIAAPSFLGILRKSLTDQTGKLVGFELDKNLVTHSVDDIQKHLP
jgi:protein required for attachment to host cells